MVQNIAKAIHRGVFYFCVVGMTFILMMTLLTVFDVMGRNFFLRPITGAFEISKYMLVFIVTLSIAYTQQLGRHIRVDLFANKLPLHARLALDTIFTLLAVVLFSLVAWQGWEGGFAAIGLKSASDLLHIPSYPFEFLIAVGAFLMFLELLLKLVSSIRNLKGSIDEKGPIG